LDGDVTRVEELPSMTSGQPETERIEDRDASGLEVRYVARHYGEPVFRRSGRDHEIGAVIAERGAQRRPNAALLAGRMARLLAVERQHPIQPGRKRARKIRVCRAMPRSISPMLMTLRKRSVVRCRSNHATTIGLRSRLRSSDTVTVSIRNIRDQDRASAHQGAGIRHRPAAWRGITSAKERCARAFEAPQAFVLHHIHHDYGRLAVLGDRLRPAPRGLNHLAEPVLCILHRPTALGHP
jgi:hypothetical protein